MFSWSQPTNTTGSSGSGSGPDPRADVNGDYMINIVDIAWIARAFGATKGSELYESRADINSDSVINIIDIGIVASNFGRTF
jgi:hypothetical protein